jgi:hypothetical protein
MKVRRGRTQRIKLQNGHRPPPSPQGQKRTELNVDRRKWAKDEYEGRASTSLPGGRRRDEGQRLRSPGHTADQTDRLPW